ncbi:programmed cell death protein, putative [Entamoeba invadens IP1]|uniref:Programmed cell death protein, putative n=1 Tax=Entamoeba invadens IP1 TaxID=370355 RepID=A0A0A1U4H3_ENTIV|nr:programmed cell death protein, putative [Entamoeba invadens IP1]ELP89151.1 programmed cell death protein, putative [Entamoeba invadens IP1]|eukprot:XP_004255922.1 programmed cell death protein, putative [Entamoeba invadens IP1]
MEEGVVCGFLDELHEDDRVNPLMNRCGGVACWLSDKVGNKNKCPYCNKEMLFMVQVYAPLEFEYAYHRVVYLFHCPFCLKFVVLRNQIGMGTLYDDEDYCESIVKGNMCEICGFPSTTKCDKCDTYYCGVVHKLYDFDTHKLLCGRPHHHVRGKLNGRGGAIKRQKASEYLIETEEESELKEPEDKEVQRMINTSKEMEKESGTKESDIPQEATDPVLLKFYEKIGKAPSQVLRYKFGGKPVWIKTDTQLTIPKCKRCGKECVFEWQLLPQFIYATNLDIELNIEFGTIAIYVCPDSCGGDDYVYENVIVQYFI